MTLKKISAEELYNRLENNEEINIVDVRVEKKYQDFHLKAPSVNSKNIVKTEIFALAEDKEAEIPLEKNQAYIITCTTGNSATKCANILSEQAYDVTVLDGGLTAWKAFLEKHK